MTDNSQLTHALDELARLATLLSALGEPKQPLSSAVKLRLFTVVHEGGAV